MVFEPIDDQMGADIAGKRHLCNRNKHSAIVNVMHCCCEALADQHSHELAMPAFDFKVDTRWWAVAPAMTDIEPHGLRNFGLCFRIGSNQRKSGAPPP